MRLILLISVLAFVVGVGSGPASAHSGGTDASGGHHCWTNCAALGYSYGEYHFHDGGGGGYDVGSAGGYVAEVVPEAPVDNWTYSRAFQTTDGERCVFNRSIRALICDSLVTGLRYVLDRYGDLQVRSGRVRARGPVLSPGDYWSPSPTSEFACEVWKLRWAVRVSCIGPNGSSFTVL